LSKHPQSDDHAKTVWTTPTLAIEPSTKPYAGMIEILHSVHDQAERELTLHPNDRQAAELERSLRHQIDDLEARKDTSAA
jgi:hypothetical protein